MCVHAAEGKSSPEQPVDKRQATHCSSRFQMQGATAEGLGESCHACSVQGLALLQQHLLGNTQQQHHLWSLLTGRLAG